MLASKRGGVQRGLGRFLGGVLCVGGLLAVGGLGSAWATPVPQEAACAPQLWAGKPSKVRLKRLSVQRNPDWAVKDMPMKGQVYDRIRRSIFDPDVCTGAIKRGPMETAPVELQGVHFTVLSVEPAQMNKLGWVPRQCTIGVHTEAHTAPAPLLGPKVLPSNNTIWNAQRAGDQLFVTLNANGYSSNFKDGSNRIAAIDLCTQQLRWVSQDLRNNAPFLLVEDALITGYGFTDEKDFLYVLDAKTGKELQKLPLAKAPEAFAIDGDRLTVRIYDGLVTYQILGLTPQKKAGATPEKGAK